MYSVAIAMGHQFLVRSQGHKHHLRLKTVVHDGVDITRLHKDGMAVFEITDPDVVLELIVRCKSANDHTDGVPKYMKVTKVYGPTGVKYPAPKPATAKSKALPPPI